MIPMFAIDYAAQMLGCKTRDLPYDLRERLERVSQLIGRVPGYEGGLPTLRSRQVVAMIVEQWEREATP